MGPQDSDSGLLQFMANRCSELEAGQASLKAQLDKLARSRRDGREVTSTSGDMTLPGNFKNGNPYSHVLQSINHSVHVTRPSSGEIIYWYYEFIIDPFQFNGQLFFFVGLLLFLLG